MSRSFRRPALGVDFATKVYKQERVLSELLYKVRTMCSSVNIANSAPAEIITRIAMELIPLRSKRYRNLISMSHVCKSWRDAIISYPLLWNTIDNDSEMVTRMCLERSGSLPLTVALSDFDTWSSDSRCLVWSHAGRFETLSLAGSPTRGLSEIFKSLTPSGKPLLRELSLRSKMYLSTACLNLYGSLRSPILSTTIPTLRKISLSSFPLTPQLCALRDLTDVQLIGLGATPTNAVIDLLANNPRLKQVTICDMEDSRGSPRRDLSITLPHLRNFLVRRCNAIDILRCLHLPRSNSLRVTVTNSFEKTTLPTIYRPYSTFDLARDFGFHEVHIFCDPGFHLKVSNWSLREVAAEFGELPPSDAEVLGPSTVEFIKHLRFREAQEHSVYHPLNLLDAFCHMDRLETLTLDCLTASLDKIFRIFINVICCPLLHTVIVRLLEGEAVDEWDASLLDVVRARKDDGHAIQRLRIVVSSEEHVTASSGVFNPLVQEVEILVREPGEDDEESWLVWGD